MNKKTEQQLIRRIEELEAKNKLLEERVSILENQFRASNVILKTKDFTVERDYPPIRFPVKIIPNTPLREGDIISFGG